MTNCVECRTFQSRLKKDACVLAVSIKAMKELLVEMENSNLLAEVSDTNNEQTKDDDPEFVALMNKSTSELTATVFFNTMQSANKVINEKIYELS